MGQNYADPASKLVIVGSFGVPFGVRGWLKVNSYTDPRSNLWNFKDWFLQVGEVAYLDNTTKCKPVLNYFNYSQIYRIKESKEKFLVLLDGISDRSMAATLTNKKILVKRSSFPRLAVDQYYWVDLLGARVYNLASEFIGTLDYVFYNGANDVMVVKSEDNKEHLIPYSLNEFVISIDLIQKIIKVKWDLN